MNFALHSADAGRFLPFLFTVMEYHNDLDDIYLHDVARRRSTFSFGG